MELTRTFLDFPSAMAAVRDGKTITKSEWHDENVVCRVRDGQLQIHLSDGWHTWTISDGDLAGTDYYITD